ncbi:MAG: hypothetical protein KJZ78_26085 [Bryobacteraceae bacterium]|nr:hypothetical protein [Bryobacteraceae bacterium]
MPRQLFLRALAGCVLVAGGSSLSITVLAQRPTLADCPVFPSDHILNTRVDDLPVHARSRIYIDAIGRDKPIHPDFGSGRYKGILAGIPFHTVPADQKPVRIEFESPESDPGPYPIPLHPTLEGDGKIPNDTDRHLLILQQGRCRLYEIFAAAPQPDGSWRAGSGAVFDLRRYALRPAGWTSADAAGLPMLPTLTRFDEVARGAIRHALRFTAPVTQRAYEWPARHFASRMQGTQYPPMGLRLRLRADFPSADLAPQARVIAEAMKLYGIILADNGGPWYLSGAPDPRWENSQLQELRRIRGADLEAVDVSTLRDTEDSARSKRHKR